MYTYGCTGCAKVGVRLPRSGPMGKETAHSTHGDGIRLGGCTHGWLPGESVKALLVNSLQRCWCRCGA
eukprot:11498706-Alexandrium_andersonii.AAC.1